MKHTFLFLFGVLTVWWAACTSSPERLKQKAEEALRQAEAADLNNTPGDSVKLIEAQRQVLTFTEQFKDDPAAPELLYRLGMTLQMHRKSQQAIEQLRKVHTLYPTSPSAHRALFLEAFILANELNDTASARKAYTLYLDNYSQWDEKLTEDARFELKHLGKSPDELLQEILDTMMQDSAQAPS
ncbi:MAG: hypothetical protein NZL95_09420 [Chitinophagales bacterium]|nr:hypothetical protein [Chitinophagales bacterium]MDW8428753.1 hypothetical protein [Chitinophagales bacterium]